MNEADPGDRQHDYVATDEELQVIDAAMAAIDAGKIANESEVEVAFAKFRRQAPN
jgi:hypothetical protein